MRKMETTQNKNGKGYEQAIHTNGKDKKENLLRLISQMNIKI